MKNRLRKTFLDLIKIDEIYNQEEKIIKYVENYFRKLNISLKNDPFGNVIAYYPGTGNPVMLNTHLDIPENVPNLGYKIEKDSIRSTGKSILGADPKSGLAVLLELASHLKENRIKTSPIEFVFTKGEEAGLFGALHLEYSLLRSKIGLVLDEDGPCTNVVTQAPGYYRLDITVTGKTVHPRDWREGVNALAITSNLIAKLKQGELKRGVTFNIGIFKAGTARNSVAGTAELKAELRSFDTEKLVKEAKKVEKLFRSLEKDRVRVRINGKLEFESYKLTQSHALFKKLAKTYKKMGLKPQYYKTYGGSDANIFNAKGITAIPIGSAYYLAHQYSEYVNLPDMEKLLLFLVEFTKRGR